MLIEFRVSNFLSFKDEQTFTFVADASKKETLDNSFTDDALGKYTLLRSAVFYGANASGKSNFFAALNYVKRLVTKSKEQDPDEKLPYHPFALDDETKESRSTFEIMFAHKGIRYEYGFSLDATRIYDEWLFAYPNGSARSQRWFERPEDIDNLDDWYFNDKKLKGEKKKLVQSFIVPTPNRLFLSVASLYNEQLKDVYEWFEKLQEISPHLFRVTYRSVQYIARQMIDDQLFHKFVLTMLNKADLGIVNLDVQEESAIFNSLRVDLYHRNNLFDDTGTIIDWSYQSTGTKLLFMLAGMWFEILKNGEILIVDEINASLHPMLVRELIRQFHDPTINKNNAQLIFNTHDTTLLDSALFRRDQIWFVEKDHAGCSNVYSLLEFAPRKGEALQKGYLEGRYGALPFIGEVKFDG